ncbi:MAG: hypothetical protein Q4G58_02790 [bacterium]|nr:hypothetical protein [bacterium]
MKKILKNIALGAVGALGGGLGMAVILIGLDQFQLGFSDGVELNIGVSLVLLYLCIFITLLIHIAFHELGHVVFGLLTGYRFISYRFLSFVIQKKEKGIALKRYSVPGTMGQALLEPPERGDGKMPYVWYNLGGVLFNLLLIIISLAVNAVTTNYYVRFFFTMCIVVGIFLAITNGVPYSEKGVSDGCNLRNCHRHPEKLRYLYLQLYVVAQLAKGKTWDEMDQEKFVFDKEKEEVNSFTMIKLTYTINMLYNRRDFAGAREYVELIYNNKENLNGIHKQGASVEMAFLELVGENRREVVEQFYTKETQKYLKAMKYEVSSYRVQMAYEMYYNHDFITALKCYKMGAETAAKAPYYGEAILEKGLLDYLKERIEELDQIS